MLNQKQINSYEDNFLADYAMKSRLSRGRKYKEKEHAYRSTYQRDRDRIIHSAAFRRLEYKTQVFVIHEGDYYRTRLTHSIEVAQIARTIASALRLNVDLVEAIALAHDLGHTPFGHAGEDALNELMLDHGGFNHNFQGLRVVDKLEERYPEFPGLNLSWEVREGIAKHSTKFDTTSCVDELIPREMPTLETQVVDIADEIAYDNHDLDDGLTSGLIQESDLKKIELWAIIDKDLLKDYTSLNAEQKKYLIIRSLINLQVTDLIKETHRQLDKFGIKSCKDVKQQDKKLVSFSGDIIRQREPLRNFLMNNLYMHYRVTRMSTKYKRFMKQLFQMYIDKLELIPPGNRKNIEQDGMHRVVCDYIAGMTDRFALDEYKKLFDPDEKV